MGNVSGFLDIKRQVSSHLPVEQRITNWNEFSVPLSDEDLAQQGARCMDCGTPWCHAIGCPVLNLIPEWNDLVYRGDWRGALTRLEMTNSLPEITGRICPAPCEAACTLSINSSPVTIKQLELAIVERGFANGWITPRPPKHSSGKRVAIIGSGPAGLSAAQQLCRAGHEVTVFDRSPQVGGLLRYGIPDFKLEKRIIDRRIEQMEAEGVRFETGVEIGEDISARYLRRMFDVVLLAMGAGEPRDLSIPGRELNGVHFALDFLTGINRYNAGEIGAGEVISAKNKVVVVIGGGDTGSDCVGTAIRQGAREVHQFEILAKPQEWKECWNPNWPYWPNILRTSTSHEEGCNRQWATTTSSFSGSNGGLKEGHFARVEWKKSASNAMDEMHEVPGSDFSMKVDLVLLAMGFLHVCHGALLIDLGVEFDQRGNIRVGNDYSTSVPGVFAAGDSATGASLVVRSIFHGRQAAIAIDRFLQKE